MRRRMAMWRTMKMKFNSRTVLTPRNSCTIKQSTRARSWTLTFKFRAFVIKTGNAYVPIRVIAALALLAAHRVCAKSRTFLTCTCACTLRNRYSLLKAYPYSASKLTIYHVLCYTFVFLLEYPSFGRVSI